MKGRYARSPLTILTAVAFAAALHFGDSPALAAEKKPKLSPRLRLKREQLNRLHRELDRERKQATEAGRRERSLFGDLDRTDRQLQQKGRELKGLQEKLRTSTERLQALRKEIGLTHAQLDQIQGLFRRRVRAIYKQGRFGYVRALLSAEDLSSGGRRIKYLAVIAYQDQRMVAAYTAALETLQAKRAELERSKLELVASQKAVAAKREEILEEQRARRRLLAMVQEQKKGHLAAIRQLELAARELQDLIGRLQGEARAQRGRRPTPDPTPGSASPEGRGPFASLKGRLPWPTSGALSSSFGRQEHPRYRTVTFNRGIEINAPQGQKILAVFGGSVLYADWFKGYGRLIVLDHGEGYYTVYAHAAEILVRVGEQVARRQSIGLVGDTGSVTGSQLYFEVRHRGRPQDPLGWLAPN